MKKRIILTINLILAIFLAVFTVGYTFAWFADYYTVDIKLYVETDGGYFASGDGSESSPYIISKPRHLYNLAWLQNTGRISNNTYFEISTNLDMSGYIIPPIGNDAHPFNSIINGNGCTISNLKVTTNKQTLSASFVNERSESYTFSKYVGLFGNTGTSSNIYNFILNDPVVEVASSNTSYSSSGSSACCGLAIGYVAGSASSIGVIGGTLAVRKEGYTTYNSILGSISSSLSTSVTGGSTTTGSTSGSTLGYGTSTDIEALYNALLEANSTGTETEEEEQTASVARSSTTTVPTIKADYALPFRTESTTIYASSYGDLEQDSNGTYSDDKDNPKYLITSDKTLAYTQAASSSNIGYYIGSDIKVYYKPNNVNYATIYSPHGDLSQTDNDTAYTLCTTTYDSNTGTATVDTTSNTSGRNAPSEEIVKYLYENGSYILKLTDYTNSGNYLTDNGNLKTVNGRVGTYSGLIVLPTRSIWVAPIQAGTIKIVVMNIETSKNGGLYVLKLKRSTAKDYSTKFSSVESVVICNGNLLPKSAYYFEIEVSSDDVANGYEFAITAEKGDVCIAYIDLGQTGSTTDIEESSGNYEEEYDVSAIDFIYKGVTIAQDGEYKLSFIYDSSADNFTPTSARITFTAATTESATIILAFYRNENGYYSSTDTSSTIYTMTVTYYISSYGAPSDSNSKAYIAADSTDTLKDFDITTYSTDSS